MSTKTQTPPNRRRWIFRLLAIGFLPLVLAAAELFLRLTGAGLPSAFAIKNMNATGLPLFTCASATAGRECKTSRFHDGYIAPQKFLMPKPDGVIRVFILGESVAAGYPYNLPGSFGRIMAEMLRLGRRRLEIINVAVPGSRSDDTRQLAREVMQYQPDWIILYLGNNVFLDLDPGDEVGPDAHARHWLRRRLLGLRLYSLAVAIRTRAAQPPDQPPDFTREAVATREKILCRPWPPEPTLTVLHRFERDLDDIVGMARDHGARVLIASVPVNLRDFYPFPPKEFSRADRCQAPLPGDTTVPTPAATAERDACAAEPNTPDPATRAYRLGCCALWAGDVETARTKFIAALEHDNMKLRATPAVNNVIRRRAQTDGVFLVDVEAAFTAAAPGGIPGDAQFLDQVHPDLDGQLLIARLMVEAMGRAGVFNLDPDAASRLDRAAREYIERIPADYRASSLATLAGRIANSGFFTRALRLYRRANAISPAQAFAEAGAGLEKLIADGDPPGTPTSPERQ